MKKKKEKEKKSNSNMDCGRGQAGMLGRAPFLFFNLFKKKKEEDKGNIKSAPDKAECYAAIKKRYASDSTELQKRGVLVNQVYSFGLSDFLFGNGTSGEDVANMTDEQIVTIRGLLSFAHRARETFSDNPHAPLAHYTLEIFFHEVGNILGDSDFEFSLKRKKNGKIIARLTKGEIVALASEDGLQGALESIMSALSGKGAKESR